MLSAHAVRRGVVTPRVAVHALHPAFAVYVLCLGVVVVAVAESFLGDLVAAVLLAYTGLLANLLWRRRLVPRGLPPSTVTFHRLSALVTVPTAVSAVVVLWLWAPLVG